MKYLCLCYYDVEKFAALSQDELAKIGPVCRPYDERLRATGKVIVVGSLADPTAWKSLHPVNGKPAITDGPYTPIPEQAGAFFLIDADNIDEAVAVASHHPAANYGEHLGWAVEVRPCESYD